MPDQFDEYGIPIKKKQQPEVDEFGIPIKKKAASISSSQPGTESTGLPSGERDRIRELTIKLQTGQLVPTQMRSDNLRQPVQVQQTAAAIEARNRQANERLTVEQIKKRQTLATPKPQGAEVKPVPTAQGPMLTTTDPEQVYDFNTKVQPVNTESQLQKEMTVGAQAAVDALYETPGGRLFYDLLVPLSKSGGRNLGNVLGAAIRYGGRALGASEVTENWANNIVDFFNERIESWDAPGSITATPTRLQGGLINDGKLNASKIIPSTIETLTTMAWLTGAGSGAGRLVASSMALTAEDYRREGVNAGLKGEYLEAFVTASTGLTSMLEIISPNRLITGQAKSSFAKEYAKAVANGYSKRAATSFAAKELTKEITLEQVQEFSQMAGDKFVKYATGKMTGNDEFAEDLTFEKLKDEAIETAILTFAATGAMSTPGAIRNASRFEKSAWWNMAQEPQKFNQYVEKQIQQGNMTPQQVRTLSDQFERYRGALEVAKTFGFSENQQVEAAWEMFKSATLEQNKKQVAANPALKNAVAPDLNQQQKQAEDNIRRIGMGVPDIGGEVSGQDVSVILSNIGDKGQEGIPVSLAETIEQNELYRVEEIDLAEYQQQNPGFAQYVKNYKGQNYGKEGLTVPAVLDANGNIIDGTSRLAEQVKNGQTTARIFKPVKTQADAQLQKEGQEEVSPAEQQTGAEAIPAPVATTEAAPPAIREQEWVKRGGQVKVVYQDGKRVAVNAKNKPLDQTSKEAKAALKSHATKYNYNFGERAPEPDMADLRGDTKDDAILKHIAETSNNPAELAALYLQTNDNRSMVERIDALDINDARGIVLREFAMGAKISPESMKKLLSKRPDSAGNKRYSQEEFRQRISLVKTGAPTIESMAEEIAFRYRDVLGTDNDYGSGDPRKLIGIIESALLDHVSGAQMGQTLLSIASSSTADEAAGTAYSRFQDLTGIELTPAIARIAAAQDIAPQVMQEAMQEADAAPETELTEDQILEINEMLNEELVEEDNLSTFENPVTIDETGIIPTQDQGEPATPTPDAGTAEDGGGTTVSTGSVDAGAQQTEGQQALDDLANELGEIGSLDPDDVDPDVPFDRTGSPNFITPERLQPIKDAIEQLFSKVSGFGGVDVLSGQAFEQAVADATTGTMQKPDGTIYGFTKDGKIFLNGDVLNANTPIHEAGHLLMQWAKTNNKALYDAGMRLVGNTTYLNRVKENPVYQQQAQALQQAGATESQVEDFYRDEALALAIGEKGEAIANREQKRGFTEWLNRLFEKVKNIFGEPLEKMTARQFGDMTFNDFVNKVSERILSGNALPESSLMPGVQDAQMMAGEQQQAQQQLTQAEKELRKAQDKLRAAEDKIAKEQGQQQGMFGQATQMGMFAADRSEVQQILDPIRAEVAKARQKVEQARRAVDAANNAANGQMALFMADGRQISLNFDSPKPIETKVQTQEGEQVVKYESAFGNNDYPVAAPSLDIKTVEQIWTEDKNLQFSGAAKVKSAADVAYIMRLLENKSVELAFAVHVDKNGDANIQMLSIGGITGTVVDPRAVLAGAKRFNSVKTYLVHNHPSGNMKPSNGDVAVTDKIYDFFGEIGVDVEHVIMNTFKREYTLLSKGGDYSTQKRPQDAGTVGEVPYRSYMMDGVSFLTEPIYQVRSVEDVSKAIYQMRFAAIPKTGVLILNSANQIIGNHVFKGGDVSLNETVGFFSEYPTAISVIFYGNKPADKKIVTDISRALKNGDISVLDYVNVLSDEETIGEMYAYNSAAEQGWLNEAKATYGINRLVNTGGNALFMANPSRDPIKVKMVYESVNKALQNGATEAQVHAQLMQSLGVSNEVAQNIIVNARFHPKFKKITADPSMVNPAVAQGVFTAADIDQAMGDPETAFTRVRKAGGRFIDKFFSVGKGLPKEITALREMAIGERNADVRKAVQLVEDLRAAMKKANFTDTDAVDALLRGQQTNVNVPVEVAGLVTEMRAMVDKISRDLVVGGYVTPNQAITIMQNMGEYMNRAYRMFEQRGWSKEVPKNIKEEALRFLAQREYAILYANKYQGQAGPQVDNALKKQAIASAERQLQEMLDDISESYGMRTKSDKKDVGVLKQRKEIPKEIRQLLGEYSNPGAAFVITIGKMSALKANAKLLTSIREIGMGTLFYEENDPNRPKEYSVPFAGESSEVWSPLNGLYTTPEIKKAFEGSDRYQNEALAAYVKVIGGIRWGKTVLSPVTQAKNFESNIGFAIMNGHWDLTKAPDAFRYLGSVVAGKDRSGKAEPIVDKLTRLGLMDQGVNISELRKMLQDDNLRNLILEASQKKDWNVLRKAYDYLNKVYSASDNFFKMYGFLNEAEIWSKAKFNKKYADLTQSEMKEIDEIAAERIKNTYPTYGRVWDGAKWLSERMPIFGNFLSFQAESMRVFLNSVGYATADLKSKDPAIRAVAVRKLTTGLIPYAAARTTVNYAIASIAGIGFSGLLSYFNDDEENEKRAAINEFVPKWMRSGQKFVIKDKDGKWVVYNLSSIDNYGAIFKPLNALREGSELFKDPGMAAMLYEFVGPFVEGEMLFESIMDVMFNENTYGGKIYKSGDLMGDKFLKGAGYVIDQMKPSAIDFAKRLKENPQRESAGLLGLKPLELDIQRSFSFRLKEVTEAINDERQDYSSRLYKINSNETMTPAEKNIARRQLKEEIDNNYRRLLTEGNKLYRRALLLGANRKEIEGRILKQPWFKGFDSDVKNAIITGRMPAGGFVQIKTR